jgi:hypothetical protein
MKQTMMVLLMMVILPSCTKLEFDGFDPTTTAFRWIMKHDLKRTSVHITPSASPCTATLEAVEYRGGVEPLPSCEYVHGKHGG